MYSNLKYIQQLNESITNIEKISSKLNKHEYRIYKSDLNIDDKIYEIRERLADKNFYVGVIGESSCGKSTFINAFIEKRYLVEDIIHGTTCSSTIIKYNEFDDIIVHYKDGHIKKMSSDANIESIDIKDYLCDVTAIEENAKNIINVEWLSPIDILKDGMIIIDTAGISTSDNNNERHRQIAERHIQIASEAAKQCDVLLILTHLIQPLSKALLDFVRKISDMHTENCIFIGTCADKMNDKELERMRLYFKSRLQESFGKELPFFFVSAYKALDSLENNTDINNRLRQFRDFRNEICKRLESNRQIIQCKNIIGFARKIINDIDCFINSAEHEINDQIDKINKEVINTNTSFWQEEEKYFMFEIKKYSEKYKYEAKMQIYDILAKEMTQFIFNRINGCGNTSDLKEYLEDGINDTINYYENKTQIAIDNINKSFMSEMEKLYTNFADKCRTKYKQLKDIATNSYSTSNTQQGDAFQAGTIKTICSIALKSKNDIDFDEDLKIGGGLTGGLALGIALSVMLPGVGWIVGGVLSLLSSFLGGLFGAFTLKSLSNTKNEIKGKINNNLQSAYKNLSEEIDKKFEEIETKIKDNAMASIHHYKDSYNKKASEYNENLMKMKQSFEEDKIFLSKSKSETKQIESDLQQLKEQMLK